MRSKVDAWGLRQKDKVWKNRKEKPPFAFFVTCWMVVTPLPEKYLDAFVPFVRFFSSQFEYLRLYPILFCSVQACYVFILFNLSRSVPTMVSLSMFGVGSTGDSLLHLFCTFNIGGGGLPDDYWWENGICEGASESIKTGKRNIDEWPSVWPDEWRGRGRERKGDDVDLSMYTWLCIFILYVCMYVW